MDMLGCSLWLTAYTQPLFGGKKKKIKPAAYDVTSSGRIKIFAFYVASEFISIAVEDAHPVLVSAVLFFYAVGTAQQTKIRMKNRIEM